MMEVKYMLIQITKKTEPLFNAIDEWVTKAESQAYASENPLFTWTGKYFTQNRKKILCLINNQTLAVVIINDVNATKKKKIEELIRVGISASLELCAISQEQIHAYLDTDPTLTIGPTTDRRITGVLNETVLAISTYGVDLNQEYPLRMMLTLNNSLLTVSQPAATDEASKAFDQPLHFTPMAHLGKKLTNNDSENTDKYTLQKNWQSYHEIEQVKNEDEETFLDQLTSNNDIILDAFSTYLEEVRGLSPKSVRKHQSRAKMYIQDYLNYYYPTTPIDTTDDFDIIVHFLSAFILDKHIASSKADFNSYKTALKHFYTFLNYVGEISDNDFKLAKNAITIGGDDSFYELANMGGSFWF